MQDHNRLSPEEQETLRGLLEKTEIPEGRRPVGVAPDHGPLNFGQAPPPNPPTIQRLPTAEQWVNKQINNLTAVGETNYREGITHPKKDPILAGIAAQGRYEAQMRNPEILKRRETALRRTNMDEWASMSERIGAGRLVAGVVERRYKVERFVGDYLPKLDRHLKELDTLPDVTDADRERRMLENLRGLKKLKRA